MALKITLHLIYECEASCRFNFEIFFTSKPEDLHQHITGKAAESYFSIIIWCQEMLKMKTQPCSVTHQVYCWHLGRWATFFASPPLLGHYLYVLLLQSCIIFLLLWLLAFCSSVLLACFKHYIRTFFFSWICPAEMGMYLICLCVLYAIKYGKYFSIKQCLNYFIQHQCTA